MTTGGMALSGAERRWLNWFGGNGKLQLGWSCLLNRSRYPEVERTFAGIGNTRLQILKGWAHTQWQHMENLARLLAHDAGGEVNALLSNRLGHMEDFSELFVIDSEGGLLHSTHRRAGDPAGLDPRAVAAGLRERFLHGPYADPVTERLGPSSSRFHDQMTLMFYQPILRDGSAVGCVCGRVPNDVLGDLIQREAGHVYPESGDNYLFMAESRFDTKIAPGTALSRSRFEDDTFSFGDNLKQGIATAWGTVKVRRHTELELRFVDPATGELHPGVRETMRNGSNLFVRYPGYSDYRHIPVIGTGVTFQLPGSPDLWGMMCEGDLEEVYRLRPLHVKLLAWHLLAMGVAAAFPLAAGFAGIGSPVMVALAGAVAGGTLFYLAAARPLAGRLQRMSERMLDVVECGGDLNQTVDVEAMSNDETAQLARWINSFIDKLNGIVGRVSAVAENVSRSADGLADTTAQVASSTGQQREWSASTATAMEEMTQTVSEVAGNAERTEQASAEACQLSEDGLQVVSDVSVSIREVASRVDGTAQLVRSLNERSAAIGGIVSTIKEISEQTNMLALNAAIEAARAGEQGRGFAVVADEVRGLANRASKATQEISDVLDLVVQETSSASEGMEAATAEVGRSVEQAGLAHESLSRINQGASSSVEMIREIARATRDQGDATSEIARNVENTASLADSNNQRSREAHVSASEMAQTAVNLQHSVSLFKS